jgi:ubiquinone/menaquinone biosynthesis C-methylase UbiE
MPLPASDEALRWEAYLRAFHRQTPRASSLGHEFFADARGQTSYARFATILERVPDPSRLAVLDLGCGDGRLIDHIRAITGDAARVDGIDLVPEEIERAKAWGRRATLTAGRAQALPYDDASFGAVLSHFAFSLMLPAQPVVAEIERVLRPRGFFATASASFSSVREDLADLLVAFREEVARAGGGALRPQFDERPFTPAGIAALFAAAGSTRAMRHEAVPFVATVDADAAWLYLSTLYFFDVIEAPGRARLRRRLDTLARSRSGRLRFQMTIEFVAMLPPPTERNLPR